MGTVGRKNKRRDRPLSKHLYTHGEQRCDKGTTPFDSITIDGIAPRITQIDKPASIDSASFRESERSLPLHRYQTQAPASCWRHPNSRE